MYNELPITWNQKIKYSIPLSAFFIVSYVIPNRFQFVEPKTLPLLSIDSVVPFLPWTIFIYLTEWFIFIFVLFFIFDNFTFRRLLLSFIFTFLISMFAFFLYPTTILFRPDVTGEGLTYFLFKILHFVDNPVNCFPSQHVAIVSIPPMIFWRNSKRLALFFWTWAILVSISTLTTKQHYFIDIIGGIFLAWISVLLANKYEKREFLFRKMLPS